MINPHRPLLKWALFAAGVTAAMVLTSCSPTPPMVVTNTVPAAGTVLSESPNSLRIFFTEAPDAENSHISMTGPGGEVTMTLLHTMGMNDLMIFINDLPLPAGDYTVNWRAPLGDIKKEHSGSFSFSIAAKAD